MHQRYRLLRLLADGRFHSGEALGAALGIGRSAVWKLVASLGELGLEVFGVTGRGYRLAYPIEFLDRTRILDAIAPPTRQLIADVDVHNSLESTNRLLLERAANGLANGSVCLAEHQTDGRGRRGRSWVSPFGANVYLSLYWRFDDAPQGLNGLSLAAGVAVARALGAAGIDGVGLKWPNDIIWEQRKLAGILIEMSGEATGPTHVVAGVGLNVAMPRSAGEHIDQPWADVQTASGGAQDRNQLSAGLIQELAVAFSEFATAGLGPALLHEWERLDVIRGRTVALRTGQGEVVGTAVGLDEFGSLLVMVNGKTQRYHSGEVSLRV